MRTTFICLFLCIASMAYGQEKGPKAEAEHRAKDGQKANAQSPQQVEHSFKTPLVVQLQPSKEGQAVGDGNANEGKKEVPDSWTILGYRMKVTDFLQALSSVLLFCVTVALALIGALQWCSSRDTAMKQLRAYIGIEADLGLKWNQQDPGMARMRFQNFGVTHARNVRVFGGVSKDRDSIDRSNEKEMVRGLFLSPRNHAALNFPKNPAAPSSSANTFCVHGRIEYTDVYRNRWCHSFAHSYGEHGDGKPNWMPVHPHNKEEAMGKDPEVL